MAPIQLTLYLSLIFTCQLSFLQKANQNHPKLNCRLTVQNAGVSLHRRVLPPSKIILLLMQLVVVQSYRRLLSSRGQAWPASYCRYPRAGVN